MSWTHHASRYATLGGALGGAVDQGQIFVVGIAMDTAAEAGKDEANTGTTEGAGETAWGCELHHMQ